MTGTLIFQSRRPAVPSSYAPLLRLVVRLRLCLKRPVVHPPATSERTGEFLSLRLVRIQAISVCSLDLVCHGAISTKCSLIGSAMRNREKGPLQDSSSRESYRPFSRSTQYYSNLMRWPWVRRSISICRARNNGLRAGPIRLPGCRLMLRRHFFV